MTENTINIDIQSYKVRLMCEDIGNVSSIDYCCLRGYITTF